MFSYLVCSRRFQLHMLQHLSVSLWTFYIIHHGNTRRTQMVFDRKPQLFQYHISLHIWKTKSRKIQKIPCGIIHMWNWKTGSLFYLKVSLRGCFSFSRAFSVRVNDTFTSLQQIPLNVSSIYLHQQQQMFLSRRNSASRHMSLSSQQRFLQRRVGVQTSSAVTFQVKWVNSPHSTDTLCFGCLFHRLNICSVHRHVIHIPGTDGGELEKFEANQHVSSRLL